MTRSYWQAMAGTLLVSLVLLALSYLGLLHFLPPLVAVGLAFLLVLILPGWLLSSLVMPAAETDPLARVGLSFTFSLALLILPATAVLYLNLNLSAFRALFLVFFLLLAVVCLFWSQLVGLARRLVPFLAARPETPDDALPEQASWRRDLPLLLLLAVAAAATFAISSGGGLDGDQIAYLGFVRGIYDDLPASGLDPLFGTGLPVPPRAAYNPWGVLPPFIARLSGVDLADTLGRYLPALLAVVSLAALYVLVKELTRRRDAALFLVTFQVLFYLAAPFHRHGNLAYAFFRRLASDKFMLLFLVLPVALYLVLRFLRSGRRRWFVLAGLAASGLIIHPIDIAFFAVAAGALAGLYFLVRPAWSGLRRAASVGLIVFILLMFPLALRQSVEESRSAYLFPASFDNLPLLQTPVLVLPNLWEESMQMPGQQPKIVTPPPGAPNPFLVYRLWSQINGQGLLIFSPTTYMSHPDLLWDAGTLLALLLAPLALLRVRRSALARYILATTIPFLVIAFVPWIAPIVGKVVTPWLLYRFTWPLPVAIILGAALFLVLERVGRPLPRPVAGLLPAVVLLIATGLSTNAIQARLQSFVAASDVPRALPPSVVTALREQVPADSVILSDYQTNQVIPATVSRRYVVAHRYTTTSEEFPDSRQPEAIQRSQDVDTFSAARLVDTTLLDMLARYHSNLVLLRSSRELAMQLRNLPPAPDGSAIATRLFAGDGFELYRVISPTVPSPIIEGNTLLGQARWADAAHAFQSIPRPAAGGGPDLAAYGLALALSEEQNLEQAATVYRQGLAVQNPPDPYFQIGLARTLIAEAKPEEALALYQQATSSDPSHDDWFAEMGDLYLLLDRSDEAAQAFMQSVGATVTPDTLTYYSKLAPLLGSKGLNDAAVTAYQAALALSPNDLTLLTPLGNLLRDRGRFAEAETVYHQALAADPSEPDGYIGLATLLQREGNYAQADPWYAQGVSVETWRLINPDDTLLSWGQLAEAQGNTDLAQARFQEMARVVPHDARPYVALGDLALKAQTTPTTTNAREQARAYYQRAVDAAPKDPAGYIALANLYRSLGRPDQSVATARAAVAAAPDQDLAYMALGDALRAVGRLAEADTAYRQSIALNSRNVGSHIGLAHVHEQQGNLDLALGEYQAGVRAAPYSAWALAALAGAYANQLQTSQALDFYQRAIRVDSTYVNAPIALAQLLAARGQIAQGESLLDTTLKQNPASAAALTALGDYQRTYHKDVCAQAHLEEISAWYKQALQKDVTFTGAAGSLSSLFLQCNRRADALATAQAAAGAAPVSGAAWTLLGNTRLALGDVDGALAALRSATQVEAGFLDGYINLGTALLNAGETAEAMSVYRQAISAVPSPEIYVAMGNALRQAAGEAADSGTTNPGTAARLMQPVPEQAAAGALPAAGPALNRLFAAAASAYAQALDFNAQYIGARIAMANLYTLAGEPDAAEEQLARAVALNPASGWATVALANNLRSRGQWQAAEQAYRSALRVAPGYADAYVSYAQALTLRGDRQAARRVLDSGSLILPNDLSLRVAGAQWAMSGADYAGARALLVGAAALDQSQALPWLTTAQSWVAEGSPEQALVALDRAVAAEPMNPLPWLARGQVLAADPQAAPAAVRAAYEHAATLNHTLADPYLNLAAYYLQRNQPPARDAALTQAEAIDPLAPDVALARASVLQETGHLARADDVLAAALEATPGDVDLWIARANLRLLQGGDGPTADALLAQALRLNPAASGASVVLAQIAAARGDFGQAESVLRAAAELDPANVGVQINLAALENRSDGTAARQRLSNTIALNPGTAWPLAALAARELAAGDVQAAQDHLERAVQINPTFVNSAVMLAQLAQDRGDMRGAEALLRRAIDLAPSVSNGYTALADLLRRQDRYTDTLTLVNQAVTANPAAGWANDALATLHQARGDWPAAEAAYRQALQVDPTAAVGYNNYAQALLSRGEWQAAQAVLEQGRDLLPTNQSLALAAGQLSFIRGDTLAARRTYSESLTLDRSQAAGWLGLAQTWLATGERGQALAALDQAALADPTNPTTWLVRGQILQSQGAADDLEPAAAAYQTAAGLDRSQTGPWLALAGLYQNSGRWDDTFAALDRAAQADPTNLAVVVARAAALRNQGRQDEAQAVLDDALAANPGSPDLLVARANLTLLREAQPNSPAANEARAQLQHAAEIDVTSSPAVIALAQLAQRRGDPQQAAALLKNALAQAPADPNLILALAAAHSAQAQFDAAGQVLQSALAQQPRTATLLLGLAQFYSGRGRYADALRQAQAAVALAPLSGAAYTALGNAYLAAGNQFEAALAAFQRAETVEPLYENAWIAQGQARLEAGQTQQAEADFRQAIAAGPANPAGYINLGQLLEQTGRRPEAQQQYRAAATAAPASGWPLVALAASLRSQQGDSSSQALDLYQRAAAVEPTYLSAYSGQADVLTAQGRLDAAAAVLRAALPVNLADPTIPINLARAEDLAGQTTAARDHLRQATLAAPASGWVWYTWGDSERSQGHLAEAAQAYRRGLVVEPTYALDYQGLSNLQLAQGQAADALATLAQGQTMVPGNAILRSAAGNVLRRLGRAAEAQNAYQDALQADPTNVPSRLSLGQLLESQGNLSAAREQYLAASRPIASAAALTALANTYRQSGELATAVTLYEQAIAAQASFYAPAYLALDQTLMALGRGDEGLQRYATVQQTVATSPDVQVAVGDAYRRRGRLSEALVAYRAAVTLQPGNQAALIALAGAAEAAGLPDEALATIRKAMTLKPGNSNALLTAGDVQWAQGNADAARDLYRQILALDATQGAAAIRLGNLYQLQGQSDDALAAFRQAIVADPLNLGGYVQLGQALAQNRATEEALTVYQQAADLYRNSAIPRVLIGNVYLTLNDRAAAQQAYQDAIAAEPGNIAGYINLANVYRLDKRYDEAMAQLDTAQRLNPGSGWPQEAMGNVLRQQRQLEQAVAQYEDALRRDPRRGSAVSALVGIYKGWHNLPDAAAAYEARLGSEADPTWLHAILAGIYQSLDRIEPAVQHLQAVVQADPEYPDPHAALANLYRRLGEGRKATAEYQRYLALAFQSANDLRLEAESRLQQLNLVTIQAPAAGATVQGSVQIIGTAAIDGFQYYKVEVGAGENPVAWQMVGTANSPVNGSELATWDTAALAPGTYTLRLTVVDVTGNFPPPYTVQVTVAAP